MAKIGSLGDIIFINSSNNHLPLINYNHNKKYNYSDKNIIGKNTISEYINKDLREISLKIILSADLGVNPMQELKKLEDYGDNGEVLSHFIGSFFFGNYTIRSIGSSYDVIRLDGKIIKLTVDVSLIEYLTN